jgi:transcriptional regulator GlxA family with amidase domain
VTQPVLEQQEQHLTVEQIARNRNLSTDTIRRLFNNEPGVIVISKPKTRKRIYRVLRIPESVERRVFARLTNHTSK